MKKMTHNKKRNIGILYELLIKHISNCVIEGKQKDIRVATKIIEKHFDKDTEIFKEFRVFNVLFNSKTKNKENISFLLHEAKSATTKINTKVLEREKSKLIREINYNIDRKFYQQHLPNYKVLGNIQMLINEWKNKENSNLKQIVMLQESVIDHLLQHKPTKEKSLIKENKEEKSKNKLVFSLMTKKINQRYKNFSNLQKDIIKNYALYKENNSESLKENLGKIKQESLLELKKFVNSCENKTILEKYEIVEEKIKNLDFQEINDDKIIKFLTVTKLLEEIKKGD